MWIFNLKLMSKFTRKLQERKWNIAIVDNSLEDIIKGLPLNYRMMDYDNSDAWYADPFILDVTDKHYHILAEEYLHSLGRARISKLVIDKFTMKLEHVVPLLTLPTHLSYPAIIRKGDEVYVYPESGESGLLKMYRYDSGNEKLIETSTIIEEPLADATITNLFGSEDLFCTYLHDCNGNTLHLLRKNNAGKYQEHQTFVFNENTARMAGDFFMIDGNVYRPAQECNESYGHGLVIQKAEEDNGTLIFNEVARYTSTDKRYACGIHTLNSYKDLLVVDFVGYVHPAIAKCIVGVKKLLNK